MQGQIVKQISNLWTVAVGDDRIECGVLGKFRQEKIVPLVGDYVIIDPDNKVITKILPRKNELKRPTIANVDRALIIISAKEPEFSLLLLDKTLALVHYNSIKPVICITKKDLLSGKELSEIKQIKKYYESIGIKFCFNTQKSKLKSLLKKKTVVLVGQTGAGKSTLLNRLNKHLNIATHPISPSLGRGVHTTRHTELYDIKGILFADTPGFSSLTFDDIMPKELKKTFIEFKQKPCLFSDCMHVQEKQCSVKERVESGAILKSRYESYLKILEEIGDK